MQDDVCASELGARQGDRQRRQDWCGAASAGGVRGIRRAARVPDAPRPAVTGPWGRPRGPPRMA
eukprot:3461421-Pyramimonas_sp.AAC.1